MRNKTINTSENTMNRNAAEDFRVFNNFIKHFIDYMKDMYGMDSTEVMKECGLKRVKSEQMSDIELVVKIPEETYNLLKTSSVDLLGAEPILDAVANGIPLPKDHGRLKDIDKFLEKVEEDRAHECYMRIWTTDDVLEKLDSWYAPTIIGADKESEDTK